MPPFRISVINQHSASSDEHHLSTEEEAEREAIKAALQIGTDEVIKGKPFFGAEAKVERDGQLVGRFVVSIGVSPLR
ncbi:MAG: hypothetical protein ACJ8EI_03100 [Sphingomicrobium sp.]